MRVEYPAALRLILQDEIYILDSDKILYNSPPISTPVIETEKIHFNYLGFNKKSFLIMVHYPDVEHIYEPHQTALESILKRLDLSLDDVAILNKATIPEVTMDDLMDFFRPGKLLLLGEDAAPAGIEELIVNKPKRLGDCSTLYSYSFGEMMANNYYKKAFWEQMKLL